MKISNKELNYFAFRDYREPELLEVMYRSKKYYFTGLNPSEKGLIDIVDDSFNSITVRHDEVEILDERFKPVSETVNHNLRIKSSLLFKGEFPSKGDILIHKFRNTNKYLYDTCIFIYKNDYEELIQSVETFVGRDLSGNLNINSTFSYYFNCDSESVFSSETRKANLEEIEELFNFLKEKDYYWDYVNLKLIKKEKKEED